MKRLRAIILLWGAFFVFGSAVFAFKHHDLPELPDFDQRQSPADKQERIRGQKAAAIQHLEKNLPRCKTDFDAITGSPRYVAAQKGFLSGPAAKGRGISAKVAESIAANDPHRAPKAFLKEHRELFGHGDEALANARVMRDAVGKHNGLRTTVWQQEVDGILVFDGKVLANTTKDDELVMISSRFVSNPAQARGAKRQAVPVNVKRAVAAATTSLGEAEVTEDDFTVVEKEKGLEKEQVLQSKKLSGKIYSKLTWLPMSENELRLCWDIILTSETRGESFRLIVDVDSNEVLIRRNLTSYLTNASYRVFNSDSPTPFSPGNVTTNGFQPAEVPRLLITTNAVSTNASPNGWINDGGTQTVGNNVDAHLDRNGNDLDYDLPDEARAFSSTRVFDFPLNLALGPLETNNQMSAVVNLFYWCNWMHDKLYDLGFTEQWGNFQVDNFGRGGVADDAIFADAQDGSGRDNASFTTPPDGLPGRMQMYLFYQVGDPQTPRRDGALDAEIICHEYVHGLSLRTVGGGDNGTPISLQMGGLGEGWSDFYALALLSEPGDDLGGNYPFGAYVAGGVGLADNYYFGYRRYPYTTNLLNNPLTFKDIDPIQRSLHDTVPISSLIHLSDNASEVHNMGEVWCVTLWEARANLIRKMGYTQGNQLILQLVTDAMKVTPPRPTFLEARDAIIKMDEINCGGTNRLELWAAFAKRGMGFFAKSIDSNNTSDIVESFAMPDDFYVFPNEGFVSSGEQGGPFLPNTQSYAITNVGTNVLTWRIQPASSWLNVSQTNGVLAGGTGANITISINTTVANQLSPGLYTNVVIFSNQVSGITQSRQFILRVSQPDFLTEIFSQGDLDIQNQSFTFTPGNPISFYSVCRTPATNFPTDPVGGTAISLGDDTNRLITVSSNVSIYGTSTNRFFVGSNGYLTFESGDNSFFPSATTHFNRLRISALFRDLDPEANGGGVSWKQTTNCIAVTYQKVPLWGTPTTNNFQIEMFFDGRIRVTYLELAARNGLVGLSAGTGIPNNFVESDFSSFVPCAPALEVIIPDVAAEGDGTLSGSGEIKVPVPLSTNLTISLFSSDTSEVTVPATVTLPGGETNVSFSVTISDDPDFDGTQNAKITAIAAGNVFQTANAPISIHDNENGVLNFALPPDATEGSGNSTGTVTMNAVAASDVTVFLFSGDTTELLVPSSVTILAGSNSANFDIIVVNDTLIDGNQSANLTAHVENWTDGVASLTVHDNETTNLTMVLPLSGREGNGTLPSAGVIRLSGTLATNLTVSLWTDTPGEVTVPSSIVIPAGKSGAVFDVNILDDLEMDGEKNVQVFASAPQFNNGSSSITITDDETPLPPMLPSPAHLSVNNAVTTDLSWSPALGEGLEQITNGTFENSSFAGWTTSANGKFIINDGSYVPGSLDVSSAPWAGLYSALIEPTNNGVFVMYQDVTIPPSQVVTLSWTDRIRSFSSFSTNHEFRVELRNTNNTPLSVVYATSASDAFLNEWTERSFNISSFQGQTVRLAFVVTASFALDVHLDNISLRAANPPPTLYEIFFSTNSNPTFLDFVGDTTNTVWDIPTLDPLVTYYWKVTASRWNTVSSSVWQFRTAPGISISDATVVEGDANTTTVGLLLSIPVPSPDTITVNYSITSGTATTNDYVAASGTVTFNPDETEEFLLLQVTGDNAFEPDEVFHVHLSNPQNAVIGDGEGEVTILNDDPFLAPIPNVTITEGTPFTFTAHAATVSPVTSTLITDFEAFPTTNASGTVMFRDPKFSSSAYLIGSASSLITNNLPSGHAGLKAFRATGTFITNSNGWLRLSTVNPTFLPNPTIDFQQVLQFDIYVDKPFRVGLGLRENNTTANIGTDGTTGTGNLEYVGVTNVGSSTSLPPSPSRLITAGNWQTVSFNLPYENVIAFPPGGNGVLESSTGKGVLDHLSLVPAYSLVSNSAPFNIYLDNFAVVYSNVLTFTLSNAPTGASIHPKTGIFTWIPDESQGAGVYNMTVHVIDSSIPPISASRGFTVTVIEQNRKPTLNPLSNRTVVEGNTVTFNAIASDTDLPTNTLTFSLDPGAPTGSSINPTSGAFSWTPSEAQGPAVNLPVTIRVTDNGSPSLSDSKTFLVTVQESNSPPILAPIANRTISYGTSLSFSAAATDSDIPTNILTYSLLSAPSGATIGSNNGAFSWTPNETQAPSTNLITIRVVDNGSPAATNTQSFTIRVIVEPVIQSVTISNQVVNLIWSSIVNRSYRVQYKTNLTDAAWNNLPGDVLATGTTASKTNAVDANSRIYRIQLLP